MPRAEGSWFHYEAERHDLKRVLLDCRAASTAAPPSAGAQLHSDRTDERLLFLRGTGKRVGWWRVCWRGKWSDLSPDVIEGAAAKWWVENAPWWVKLEWEQDANHRSPEACYADAIRR